MLYLHYRVKLAFSCKICICPITFAHFFIFAFFLLNSSSSCYICIVELNMHSPVKFVFVPLNFHIFFIFAFFLLNSSWSCYICIVELNLHSPVKFALSCYFCILPVKSHGHLNHPLSKEIT